MRDEGHRRRGEPERVAQRVRALLAAHDERYADDADRGDGVGAGGPALRRAVPEVLPALRPAPLPSTLDRLRARLPVRIDPGRRANLAVGLVVVLAAALTGAWLIASRPAQVPIGSSSPALAAASTLPLLSTSPSAPTSGSGTAPEPPGSSSASQLVVVDVAGKVRRPGLYRLPGGSRIDDAVRAAGGALPGVDLSTLNLAAKLVDGQQIAVGSPGAVGGGGGGGAASSGGAGDASGPVDLNSATLEQLETLPGIGPALGQRILDYRAAHGSFRSVDDLDNVSGIGTVTFARLKPLVTV